MLNRLAIRVKLIVFSMPQPLSAACLQASFGPEFLTMPRNLCRKRREINNICDYAGLTRLQ
jgi:hypothetical protein